jgi:hypothetical protein
VVFLAGGFVAFRARDRGERELDDAAADCVRESETTPSLPRDEAARRLSTACAGVFARSRCAEAIRHVPELERARVTANVLAECRAAYCPFPSELSAAVVDVCDGGREMPWAEFANMAHLADHWPRTLTPERRDTLEAADRAVVALLEERAFDESYTVTMELEEGELVTVLSTREGQALAMVRGPQDSVEPELVFQSHTAGTLANVGVRLDVQKSVMFRAVRRLIEYCQARRCRLLVRTTPTRH